jgi:hypothetical protein
MAEPRFRGSEALNSTERRRVLWGLVLKSLPEQGSIPFRTVEIVVEMLIKSVELRDPRLAQEWIYEKNTIISLLTELDYRRIVKFIRPTIGDKIDYDAATVGMTDKTLAHLVALPKEVKDVMAQVPRSLLDLLAIAAMDPS